MKILLGFVAVLVVIGGALRLAYPAYSWQQTLTFYITTPDGPVVATNTGRATYTSGVQIFIDGGGGGWSYDGEALVADLGEDKYLFSLLDNNVGLGFAVGKHVGYLDRGSDSETRWLKRSRGKVWDVPLDLLPPLVTFADITDMETLVFLEPSDIGAALGDGYALERVTFGITREPTTLGQMDVLLEGWISQNTPSQRYQVDTDFGIIGIYRSHFWKGQASSELLERVQ